VSAQTDLRAASDERAREENFPVALRLLPRDVRSQLLAVYGFARLVDDTGDEADGDRLAQLDAIESELDAAAAGNATHPVLVRLAPVLPTLDCGLQPFRDLIEANRIDQRTVTYETFEDLRGYCRLSAAPVGRIVLSIFGATSPERVHLSDEVSIGLQLVEHLQDVGEDAVRGRVYLPQEHLRREGVDAQALLDPVASPPLRRVVLGEGRRADGLLAAARPLAVSLPWQPRLAVVGFAAGGLAALDAIRAADGDVLGHRCRPSRAGLARRMLAGSRDTGRRRART
jgi:squalene synthase HpnC